MNEQRKINRKPQARTSLFERADAVFGLDNLGSSSVPRNLPEGKRAPIAPTKATTAQRREQPEPAKRPAPRIPQSFEASEPNFPPQPAPEPKPVKAVQLRGPVVEVDRDVLDDAGLIIPEDPVTGLLEEFRIVKRELLADARASDDDAARRILVCSPHSGEGKTYCATNLAIALAAERDVEIVLVDADVLNPSVPRRLGIETGAGFMDALADKTIMPEDLVISTDIDGLFVLPAGTSTVGDAELLTSARTGAVLDRLTRGSPNRFLIFDTPPALAASPAAELAAHVGQALLVVRADETSRAALDDARQLLSACPDIKLLLNAAQFSPSGRKFGDYGEREE